MRVMHVCDSIIGGTGSYLTELLLEQHRSTPDIELMLLMPAEHLSYLDERFADSGIAIKTFRRAGRTRGMVMLLLCYLRHLIGWKPQIVHAHSFGAGVVTRIVPGRWAGLIYCPHGWSFNMTLPTLIQRTLSLLEWILAWRSDALVLISRHDYDSGREYGIPARKMRLVLSGIEARAPVGPTAAWQDPRVKLLFVGRFDRQKGLDVLLRAMEPARHHACLRVIGAPVVGEGGDLPMPRDYLEPIGWQDREGVFAHMRAADAVVVPSRWEGFGLVAIEAMRLGKAVIASNVGGLAETLGNGKYGHVFPPGDDAALARTILSLTPAQLAETGRIGRERFAAAYTSDRMAQQITDIYRAILSSDPADRVQVAE
ncbi:glycosyltransferase [Sphingomonas sp. KR1UV-12]|uniref:Glycosyltransferase n=1 Tax=Sphingomonas aurea TaxID=3063994 RepID=A0ABT9EIA6_9SPHN|nr:glycosyltransferase [Sphingomonas sp. KR1UV-12]MDP1026696.1 glycosyltransferase [Sphingomonas sp. KR1UV-12]